MKAEMCSDCSSHLESNQKTKGGGADKQKTGRKKEKPVNLSLGITF